MPKARRKNFESLENVTERDVKKIVDEALAKNFKVYNRLAEI